MAYWRPQLKDGGTVKNKGYTLVEIILAIAIIGIIAVSFLPLMTFSYTNLVNSDQFTQALFDDQALVEDEIDAKRFIEPSEPNKEEYEFFGVDIPVHVLSFNTTNSGQVNVFLPKQTQVPSIPVIQGTPVLFVRNSSDVYVEPTPSSIDLLEDSRTFFVDEVSITPETKGDHLMNVYRWYTSDEIESTATPSDIVSDYTIVFEWNEARTPVLFDEAIEKSFIPNFKEYIDPVTSLVRTYNRLDYSSIQNALSFNDELMINTYGNRFIRYGVTPFSIAGRMGVEKLSNAVYIDAPKIEIATATYDEVENAVVITFSTEIEESVNSDFIRVNESLGTLELITRDPEDHHKLILAFTDELDKSVAVGNNQISRGAVVSKEYGEISIWNDGKPNDFFTISP